MKYDHFIHTIKGENSSTFLVYLNKYLINRNYIIRLLVDIYVYFFKSKNLFQYMKTIIICSSIIEKKQSLQN